MTTYNPNDFSPTSGKEINSSGNVVTPADGINSDGSQNVVLLPRKTSSGVIFSGIAITDTNTKTGSTIAVAGYTKKVLSVVNTLNQTVTISLLGTSADGTTKSLGSANVNASSGCFIGAYFSGTGTTLPGLQEPMISIYATAVCATAPTSGTLTLNISLEA